MVEPLTSEAWVASWLQKSSHDLETAQRVSHAGHPTTGAAAYHCHPAAAKALKALLAAPFEPLAKTHDLMDLLTRCATVDARIADGADRMAELSAFDTVLRCPSVDDDPNVSDVSYALRSAPQFHGLVSTIVANGGSVK